MNLAVKKTKREALLDTIAGLEKEQGELVARLSSAAERQQRARVEALLADPADRSDAKGAASPVRKLVESTRKDEERLTNVEAELAATRIALTDLDAEEAAQRYKADVNRNAHLCRRETAAIDELRKAADVFVERFAVYAAICGERLDDFGYTTDPALQATMPIARTAKEMFARLREPAVASHEPNTFPAAAPKSVPTPITRRDPRWAAASRLAAPGVSQ
jgi:hypothetical protein